MGIASKIYEEKENGLEGYYRNGCVDGCVELNGYKDGCVAWLCRWFYGWLCGMVVGLVVWSVVWCGCVDGWMVVGLAVWDGCGQLNILSDKIGRHPAPLGMLLAFSSLLGPFVAPLLF